MDTVVQDLGVCRTRAQALQYAQKLPDYLRGRLRYPRHHREKMVLSGGSCQDWCDGTALIHQYPTTEQTWSDLFSALPPQTQFHIFKEIVCRTTTQTLLPCLSLVWVPPHEILQLTSADADVCTLTIQLDQYLMGPAFFKALGKFNCLRFFGVRENTTPGCHTIQQVAQIFQVMDFLLAFSQCLAPFLRERPALLQTVELTSDSEAARAMLRPTLIYPWPTVAEVLNPT